MVKSSRTLDQTNVVNNFHSVVYYGSFIRYLVSSSIKKPSQEVQESTSTTGVANIVFSTKIRLY